MLHVGSTPRGKDGIRQRLGNHLHAQSSFMLHSIYLQRRVGGSLKARCAYLRKHFKYCCLEVEDNACALS